MVMNKYTSKRWKQLEEPDHVVVNHRLYNRYQVPIHLIEVWDRININIEARLTPRINQSQIRTET